MTTNNLAPVNLLELAESKDGINAISNLLRNVAEEEKTVQKLKVLRSPKDAQISSDDNLRTQVIKALADIYFNEEAETRDRVAALREISANIHNMRKEHALVCKLIIEGAKASVAMAESINQSARDAASASDNEIICDLHNEGVSAEDIAKLLDFSVKEVRNILKKNKAKQSALAAIATPADVEEISP